MASSSSKAGSAQVKEIVYAWEGKDKSGKTVRGELRAGGEAVVNVTLRRQGVMVTKIKKKTYRSGKKITGKDIALFTRQLATMMKAGVPLLQSFDIVGKGHSNPSMAKLIMDLRSDIETGTSLNNAFRKYPLYFDPLFCNLVGAGEQAGILEDLLTRLAIYKEKTIAMKAKIKSALMYPVSILAIAFVVTAVIMIWVVPAFKSVFASFGANLPAPTLFVMAMSEFFVKWWWLIFGSLFGADLLLLPGLAALAARCSASWTSPCSRRRSSARCCARPRSRAGPAPWPPCSPPACRWWKRSTRSAAPPATRCTSTRPARSRTK